MLYQRAGCGSNAQPIKSISQSRHVDFLPLGDLSGIFNGFGERISIESECGKGQTFGKLLFMDF
jgi:hypothetical protein